LRELKQKGLSSILIGILCVVWDFGRAISSLLFIFFSRKPENRLLHPNMWLEKKNWEQRVLGSRNMVVAQVTNLGTMKYASCEKTYWVDIYVHGLIFRRKEKKGKNVKREWNDSSTTLWSVYIS
jgi:hypothetical protein